MIKNLILLILFSLCILNPLFSKMITVKIDGIEYELEIPDDQQDLEKAFIDAFKSWKKAENDLNETEDQLKRQKVETEKLSFMLDKSMDQNKKLITLLNNRPKQTITIFRPSVLLGADYNLNQTVNASAGLGVLLFNWVDLSVYVRVPDVSIGLLLKVYLKK